MLPLARKYGVEALEALERQPYAVVLMDCHMPVMDGFAATERIRESERGRARTPVVALTASALVADRERCLAAGMDDYVAKPIDPDALASVLDRWAPAVPVLAVPALVPEPVVEPPVVESRSSSLRPSTPGSPRCPTAAD